MAATSLSAHARRVVDAIGTGRRFRRRPDGWSHEPLLAPDSLIADLARRGMIRVAGDSLAVRKAPPPVGTGSSARLLAERALPQDGEARDRPRDAAGARTRSVTVNLAESPLGWLKARRLVDDHQFEADERLRGDWTVAGMAPRVTMRWDTAPSSSHRRGPTEALDPTLTQIAAKRRMETALEAVGPGLKDVLWRVVCAGEGMETAERALGWPARAGRVVLMLALDRLADCYRLR